MLRGRSIEIESEECIGRIENIGRAGNIRTSGKNSVVAEGPRRENGDLNCVGDALPLSFVIYCWWERWWVVDGYGFVSCLGLLAVVLQQAGWQAGSQQSAAGTMPKAMAAT